MAANFDGILNKILTDFGEKETEHNWEKLEESLKRASETVAKLDAETVVSGIRRIRIPLNSSLLTERTRLSTAAMEFVKACCKIAGCSLDQLYEQLLPPLLKLCERTNKVFVQRANQTLVECFKASPQPKLVLPRFSEALRSANKGLRSVVAESMESLLQLSSSESITECADLVEKIISESLVDAWPQVRESSRRIYHQLAKSHADIAKKIFEAIPLAAQKHLGDGTAKVTSSISALKRTSSTVKAMAGNVVRPGGPARIVRPATSAAPSHIQIGAAQRVLRTTDSPSLTPGSKAARVASNQGTPVKTGLKSSVSLADTRSAAPNALTSCISAGQLPSSGTNASAVRAEIVQSVSASRNPDWAVRNKAFDSLAELLSNPEATCHIESSRPAAQRLFDALLSGLADTHFRALESVLRFGSALVGCCAIDMLPEPTMLDSMLAKAVYLAVNPQFKGKACQEAAIPFIDRLGEWLSDPWKFAVSLANAYSKPEAATSVRARLFIMSRIQSTIAAIDIAKVPEHELIFHLKTIITRVTPAILDHDQALIQHAVDIFGSLHRRLQNEALLQTLIQAVKFSSARTILMDRLAITLFQSSPTESAPSVGKEATIEQEQVGDKASDCDEQSREHSEMEIEAEGDPEPLFITLDEELGIQLRVRPVRSPTPPVDELARTLSSVLQSPFLEENHQVDDEVELQTIDGHMADEICKEDMFVGGPHEEPPNPFIDTTN